MSKDHPSQPGDDDLYLPDDDEKSKSPTKMGMLGRAIRRLLSAGQEQAPEVQGKNLKEAETFFNQIIKGDLTEPLTPEVLKQFENWSGTDPQTGEEWQLLVYPTPVSTSGGMSEICLALDIKGKQNVALKVPRREGYYRAHGKKNPGNSGETIQLSGDPSQSEESRFYLEANRREAEALTRGENMYIMPLLGSFERERASTKELVLILEYFSPDHYITGSDALEHFKGNDQAAWLEITDALGFISFGLQNSFYNGGVIHLDIKPGNFFLPISPKAYIPRLADFGAAAIVGQPELTVQAGSYPFSPPEFSNIKTTAELLHFFDEMGHEPSQVYSLAASLAHMLGIGFIGRPGIDTKLLQSFCNRVNADPKGIRLHPERLEAVFARALSDEPYLRHPTLNEFMQEVTEVEVRS